MLGLIKCAKDDYFFIIKSPYSDETAVKASRAALAEIRKIVNKYKTQTRETVIKSTAGDVFAAGREIGSQDSSTANAPSASSEVTGDGFNELAPHEFPVGLPVKEGDTLTHSNTRLTQGRLPSWFDRDPDFDGPRPPKARPRTETLPEHLSTEGVSHIGGAAVWCRVLTGRPCRPRLVTVRKATDTGYGGWGAVRSRPTPPGVMQTPTQAFGLLLASLARCETTRLGQQKNPGGHRYRLRSS